MSGVLFDLLVDYEKKHKENVVLMAQLVRLQSMTPDNDDDEPQPEMFCHWNLDFSLNSNILPLPKNNLIP